MDFILTIAGSHGEGSHGRIRPRCASSPVASNSIQVLVLNTQGPGATRPSGNTLFCSWLLFTLLLPKLCKTAGMENRLDSMKGAKNRVWFDMDGKSSRKGAGEMAQRFRE